MTRYRGRKGGNDGIPEGAVDEDAVDEQDRYTVGGAADGDVARSEGQLEGGHVADATQLM